MLEYNKIFRDISFIYENLSDDISKNIFMNTISYHITGMSDDLNKIVKYAQPAVLEGMRLLEQQSCKKLKFDSNETLIIYGIGQIGKEFLSEINQKKSKPDIIFCDKKYNEVSEFCKYPVISPNELVTQYSMAKIVVATARYRLEVHKFLIDNKVSEGNIFHFTNGKYTDPDMYFIGELGTFTKDEIFVDAGVYDGITSVKFAEKCNGNYKGIYLFEPDKRQRDRIQNNVKNLHGVEIYEYGLWNQKDKLEFKFSNKEGGGGKIDETSGDVEIQVDSLDNLLQGRLVTFIKMDIEGSELKALMGAKETIRKYKPKLAICLYHKKEDILEIPLYVKELLPEYKLYIRHHCNKHGETVLYAMT